MEDGGFFNLFLFFYFYEFLLRFVLEGGGGSHAPLAPSPSLRPKLEFLLLLYVLF